jgi:hypothetical protein
MSSSVTVGVCRARGRGGTIVISLVRERTRRRCITDLGRGRERAVGLRMAGWPLADSGPIAVTVIPTPRSIAEAKTDRLVSRVYASTTGVTASTTSVSQASPLGRTAVVPWLLSPVRAGAWVCAMVELSGFGPWRGSTPGLPAVASYDAEMHGNEVVVAWPDGTRTVTRFPWILPVPGNTGAGRMRPA